jgi:hypothetical protein
MHTCMHVWCVQVVDVQFGLPGTTEPMSACQQGQKTIASNPWVLWVEQLSNQGPPRKI